MTHDTDADRAEFEAWYIAGARKSVPAFAEWSEIELREGCMRPDSGSYRIDYARIAWDAWQAARRAPAVPVPDVTDAMREAAEEAYMPFGDMGLAIQCALAAAPQPPEADIDTQEIEHTRREAESLAWNIFNRHFSSDEHYASGRVKFGLCDTLRGVLSQIDNMVAGLVRAPLAAHVQLPEPVGCTTKPWGVAWNTSQIEAGTRLYTEQQVRQLLAAHSIKEQST
ncbi:hypothetical protein ACLS0R_14610 [Comamonas jiangduensis]|uniref:hypothetical protein n=1 Tax=Comamonas jiangduensis TaxID=1194168 RepID=UPI003BF86144